MIDLEKRKAVLEEVRDLLLNEKIEPTRGLYLFVREGDDGEDNLQEQVKKPEFKCEACAMGSLLVAYASLFNEVPSYAVGRHKIIQALGKIFTGIELEAMETEFEMRLEPTEDVLFEIVQRHLDSPTLSGGW